MGLSKKFICFCLLFPLLLFLLFQLESSSSSSSHGSSFKPAISASSQQFKPPVLQSHGSFEAGNHDHHKGFLFPLKMKHGKENENKEGNECCIVGVDGFVGL
ncbi:hypothetical protein ERO13_A05G073300v2 [Gossypium hirsutum]|uniref:Transmembrane protein n=3 Tax=Gossypium TaxID=3633 RepID=A0A0D2UI67_GOSRA|nr:hypothetical protein ERO13_A05G073300v2 [Gossypium hirsutum]KJB55460.1 hypothetical protein B456_009G077500 [Gossypium raimondii]TYI25907.1 hypothetical protein ES332_A05G079300v1 [Gossypium tomentosum]TYJ33073.1 hypothetical protein E1A91_A05G077900v1 [Gossypium mustelinum]